MATVTLSLISHTNVGKTTLARTLLRREVGQVADQAHVTDVSEAFVLIESSGDVLKLWDTPGFGDTGQLMRRLKRERDPVGWFLHQVWDRLLDRPLWCSQEAVHNVRDEADVVLYLVNAAERPQDAGYVPLELELLKWMNRPVVLLLNQVGEEGIDPLERWREHVSAHPIVRDVLSLDAFTRGWPEESLLLRRVVPLLDSPKREAMERLAGAWDARNIATFDESCVDMAASLGRAATDREPLTRSGARSDDDSGMLDSMWRSLKLSAVDKRRAMKALDRRLDESTETLMRRLIQMHGLEGTSAARIEKRFQDFQVRGSMPLNEKSGALAGAVVSGALGGLAADALSGGLTLGGGLIAGGILGALGGSALAKGYRMLGGQQEPTASWTVDFLVQLARQLLLRYLAVAHYGRGRGEYRDIERPTHWSAAVDEALGDARALRAILDRVDEQTSPGKTTLDAPLTDWFRKALRQVLRTVYPEALARR